MSVPGNPILDSKYSELTSSTDPVAQKIVKDITTMYNNAVILNTVKDVATLDNSVLNIQNTFSDFISLATPCASVSNTDKCDTPICNYVSYIESLYMDIFVLVSSLPALNDPLKSEYNFLPFFMTSYFSNMVTNNPNNQNVYALPKVQYLLCSQQTYQPTGLSPSMTAEYNALKDKMKVNQENTLVRHQANGSIVFLTYILLPTVIFIILVLLYIQYVRKAQLRELALQYVVSRYR